MCIQSGLESPYPVCFLFSSWAADWLSIDEKHPIALQQTPKSDPPFAWERNVSKCTFGVFENPARLARSTISVLSIHHCSCSKYSKWVAGKRDELFFFFCVLNVTPYLDTASVSSLLPAEQLNKHTEWASPLHISTHGEGVSIPTVHPIIKSACHRYRLRIIPLAKVAHVACVHCCYESQGGVMILHVERCN